MIRTMLCNTSTGEIRQGDESLLAEWKDDPDLWIWADFDGVDSEREKALFVETFGLHPLAIADAQRERHPPKLETFDGCFFLLVHGLGTDATSDNFYTVQITFFVGHRFMLTRRAAPSLSIDSAWSDAENGLVNLSRGSSYVAYRILRRVTDRYTRLVEGLEEKLEEMEKDMFENPRDELLENLINYGQCLKRLRRVFNYHQDIFARLGRKDYPFVGEQQRHEYTDVFEHTERLASLASLYKELTDDLMNGYISVTSHRLNQIMKVLTVVTVVFLPLTLMVGIYGMNFENMPELKYEHAYYVLLSVMGGIVAALLLLFRKMRWL
jgi:magnesium transporter